VKPTILNSFAGEVEFAQRPATGKVAAVRTTISIRRMGYEWGISHDGSLVDRHQSQATAVIAATSLAQKLRKSGRQVELRYDGGLIGAVTE
jgi:hypothetical protein